MVSNLFFRIGVIHFTLLKINGKKDLVRKTDLIHSMYERLNIENKSDY